MSENEKQLAQGLVVALQAIQRLFREVNTIKLRQEALEQVVESGKPPLAIADAERQVFSDAPASGHTPDEDIAQIQASIDRIKLLAK